MNTVANEIVTRRFGKRVINRLAKKGIKVVNCTTIPDENGSFLNGRSAYVVDDNGTGRVWTDAEIMAVNK